MVGVGAGLGDAEEPEGRGEGVEEGELGVGGEGVEEVEVWGCDFGDEDGARGTDGEIFVPGSDGAFVDEVSGEEGGG